MTRDKSRRAAYTLEYKLEAVRLVKGGQAKAVTAKVLGIPAQTLDNWVRLAAKGKLTGAGGTPASIGFASSPSTVARLTLSSPAR